MTYASFKKGSLKPYEVSEKITVSGFPNNLLLLFFAPVGSVDLAVGEGFAVAQQDEARAARSGFEDGL